MRSRLWLHLIFLTLPLRPCYEIQHSASTLIFLCNSITFLGGDVAEPSFVPVSSFIFYFPPCHTFHCATMGSKKIAQKRAPKVKRPVSPPSHEPSIPPSDIADNLTRRRTRTSKRVRFLDDAANDSIHTAQVAEQQPVARRTSVEPHIQDPRTLDSDIETAARPRVAATKAKALHAEIAANEAILENTGIDSDYDTSDLHASDTSSIEVQPTKTVKTKPVMAKVSPG